MVVNYDIKIEKRDGKIVDFDSDKIINAIEKAMSETEIGIDNDLATEIAEIIEDEICDDECDLIGSVESIQDRIEELLMESDRKDVAKLYILFRDKRSQERKKGWVMNDLQRDIFEKKYEYKNEGFEGFVNRIAKGNKSIQKLIRDKKFLPAGRIMAGRGLQEDGYKTTYSNCFVLSSPEDNIESIFEVAKMMARTYSYGGGVGIMLDNLRPTGAKVNNSAKETTGAVSFAKLYSDTTSLISQRGRRGALMLVLNVSHPDITDFINAKTNTDKITQANISVKIDDAFMKAVKENGNYDLYFKVKDTKEEIRRTVKASEIMDLICKNAHDWGEPGVLFWDRVQNYHIISEVDGFVYNATNP